MSVTHTQIRIVSVGFRTMFWTSDVWVNFNISRVTFKEWFGLEGLLKIFLFQPRCHGKRTFHESRLLKAPSMLALNNSRDGTTTNSLDNPFHCLFLNGRLNLLADIECISACPSAWEGRYNWSLGTWHIASVQDSSSCLCWL